MLILEGPDLGNFSRGGDNYGTMIHADFSMQSAILYGMDQPLENVIQQGSFNCPTGNCTWPPFESLAVCNRCIDVTARLESIVPSTEIPSSVTSFRLPNGLYLGNANGQEYSTARTNVISRGIPIGEGIMMTTLGTFNATETISAHDLDTVIWSMSMIRVSLDAPAVVWPDLPLTAMECTLFYCVNSYKFEVSNGNLTVASEQIMDARRAENSWKIDDSAEEIFGESELESIAFQSSLSEVFPRTDLMLVSPASGSRFNISQQAIETISSYYQSTFASITCDFNISDSKKGLLNGYYLNDTEIQYKPDIMQALFASQDLNATFTALAASMSNAIRTGADETFDGILQVVTGSKGDLTTFYRVVWPWVSLHCFIVVTGVVFLMLTIRKNKKHGLSVPIWRSSSLAVLNRGQKVAGILSGIQTVEQMEAMSRASQVILLDSKEDSSSLEHLAFDPLELENELEDLGGDVPDS